MTTPRTTAADPDWFVTGYRRALARFNGTAHMRDPMERFIPLFEALNWAAAIVDPNSPLRASLITDDTVRALRLVRNCVHHQWDHWVAALDPRDVPVAGITQAVGSGSRIVMPPTVLDWFWKPLNQLPPPDRPDRKGQAAYTAHLAGEPARDALGHLDALLPR